MNLSNNLISEFVKITNDTKKEKTETTFYGTVKSSGNYISVQLDGSDVVTPVLATTTVTAGDRVTVLLKDHTATITGNLSNPSATGSSVKDAQNIANKAQSAANTAQNAANTAQNAAKTAQEIADKAQSTADGNTILADYAAKVAMDFLTKDDNSGIIISDFSDNPTVMSTIIMGNNIEICPVGSLNLRGDQFRWMTSDGLTYTEAVIRPGMVKTYTIKTGGYITNGGKTIYFDFALGRICLGVTSIVASNIEVKVRQGGNYCYGTTSNPGNNGVTPESSYISLTDGVYTKVALTMGNATDVTNNDTCGVDVKMTLTFNA